MKELIFTKEANKIISEKKSNEHVKDTKNKYHCDHHCDFMGWVSLSSQISHILHWHIIERYICQILISPYSYQ